MRSHQTRRGAKLLLAALGIALAGCSGSTEGDAPATGPLIQADVNAAAGGTFTSPNGSFTITFPPGALNSDAVLTVERVANPPSVGTNQAAASDAFAVSLGGASLGDPAIVEIAADRAPVHPELGEIAELDSGWKRLEANYFRGSDRAVVTLTEDLPATLRVVFRTLQTSADVAANQNGLDVFLNETFGNEAFFGDFLRLHEVLNAAAPVDVVPLGVQVDLAKVPQGIVDVMIGADLDAKDDALSDPATTRALIQAGAVIGVVGFFEDAGNPDLLTSVGITCALCHVTVTPTSFELNTTGPTLLPIGPANLDGVPNEGMDAGAILALAPTVQGLGQATVDLLNGWGPGQFDIRALPDNPLDDGVDNPTDAPPIWNFVDLEEQDYLFGWDGLFVGDDALASQAEAVFDLVMHANGAFGIDVGGAFGVPGAGNLPPALRVNPSDELVQALVDAETGAPGNDIVTEDLLDLQAWMRSLASPAPDGFDEAMAEQGFLLFHGKAQCTVCHTTPELTGPGLFDFALAQPAGDLAGGIKVPGLRGIARTAPFLHDGSVPTLEAVVAALNGILQGAGLLDAPLTQAEQEALVEYLKSL